MNFFKVINKAFPDEISLKIFKEEEAPEPPPD